MKPIPLLLLILVSACSSTPMIDGGVGGGGTGGGSGGGTAGGSEVGGGIGGGGGGGMTANGLCYTPYGGQGGADARQGYRFATSVHSTGDLGGVAGANEKCRLAVAAAGLAPAALWVAWLGVPNVFPGAPFVGGGDDGPDFWEPIGCARANGCAGLETDEYGRVLDGGASYWTGFSKPCVSTANCDSWTSASAGLVGMADLGTGPRAYPSVQLLVQGNAESDAGVLVSCASRQRLWCLGAASGFFALNGFDAGIAQRAVFTTRERFLGAVGVAAADSRCMNAAADAGLAGTFIAFLGTASVSASQRLDGGTGWAEPGQQDVAFLNQRSFSTTPRVALLRDEHGVPLPAGEPVWTGVEPWGHSARETCAGWTSDAGLGAYGVTGAIDERWASEGVRSCSESAHLLCVQR